jgi:hypothetical protein
MQRAMIHERDYDQASSVVGYDIDIKWREGHFVLINLTDAEIEAIARASIWVEE